MSTVDPEALSPEKRAQILHGAAAVFARDGYEGASMSQIAREANVSKGTLYNHFEGKSDLFLAYMRSACTMLRDQVFEQLSDDAPPEQMLHEIGRRMIGMLLTPKRRKIYRMVVAEAEHFPELARAFYDAGPWASVASLARLLAAQVAAGRLDMTDTDFAAEQFFALCQTRLWFRYRLHLSEQPSEAEIEHVVRESVRMFLACYKPTP